MMFKILTALLFLCPLSGCMVALPLCSQIQNTKPNCVCPMPMPACRGLFKWDDDIGFMPKQPTDDVRPDYQITAGDVAMAVWAIPLYCCYVAPCIASDVFFSPYNVPAYLYCKDKKGKFEFAKDNQGYALSWRGLLANRVESKIVIVIERGHVDLFGNTNSGKKFEKRLASSCTLNVVSYRVEFGFFSPPKSYKVSCSNNQIYEGWRDDFYIDYHEKLHFTLSDDFQGSISLVEAD